MITHLYKRLILAALLGSICTGCTSTSQQQVAAGVIEILVISYQPGTYMGNKVADAKDSADHHIRSGMGNSRIGATVASQVVPTVRYSIGNNSNVLLKTLTVNILDLENLDHH
jgi:hypothetical protein